MMAVEYIRPLLKNLFQGMEFRKNKQGLEKKEVPKLSCDPERIFSIL